MQNVRKYLIIMVAIAFGFAVIASCITLFSVKKVSADFSVFGESEAEKIQEEKIRQQWIAVLPFMHLKQLKYMSFKDYYEACTGANIDWRPAKEIIQEILDAHGMESLEDFKDGNI